MTRTIEMQTTFMGDYGDEFDLRFEAGKVWIDRNGKGFPIYYEDFDRIAAELANFRKLNDSVRDAA